MINRTKFKKNKTYLINYKDTKGKVTTRFIYVLFKPKSLLNAYCFLRDDQQSFKYDRILKARKVKLGSEL